MPCLSRSRPDVRQRRHVSRQVRPGEDCCQRFDEQAERKALGAAQGRKGALQRCCGIKRRTSVRIEGLALAERLPAVESSADLASRHGAQRQVDDHRTWPQRHSRSEGGRRTGAAAPHPTPVQQPLRVRRQRKPCPEGQPPGRRPPGPRNAQSRRRTRPLCRAEQLALKRLAQPRSPASTRPRPLRRKPATGRCPRGCRDVRQLRTRPRPVDRALAVVVLLHENVGPIPTTTPPASRASRSSSSG